MVSLAIGTLQADINGIAEADVSDAQQVQQPNIYSKSRGDVEPSTLSIPWRLHSI